MPGKSYGQRILEGYGPKTHKESDTTERLSLSGKAYVLEQCFPQLPNRRRLLGTCKTYRLLISTLDLQNQKLREKDLGIKCSASIQVQFHQECSDAQSLSYVHLFRDPMECSPPSSYVYGISQARITGVGCHFLL